MHIPGKRSCVQRQRSTKDIEIPKDAFSPVVHTLHRKKGKMVAN